MEHEPEPCAVCGLVPLITTVRRPERLQADSPAMQEVLKRAGRFARSDAPVVVLGESGTGKEVVARIVHASSARAAKPFIAVNVAALPAELLESELFGHVRGAFTGATAAKRGLLEAADGGTLFLDEIAELPLALQAKMLRALQDGEIRRVGETTSFAVDARIVCATHRDLADHVRRGLFRQDLYFRLKVLTLRVPPLRARREDILPLAHQFLAGERRAVRGFAADAQARLLAYPWPGNVRELQGVVKHGAALAPGALVREEDLPEELLGAGGGAAAPGELRPLADVEREHIVRVLDACGGSQQHAAHVLGIARNTLWRKLRKYGGDPP